MAEMRKFAADSHSGLQREHNEDCFGTYPDVGLWLVADGVGGHSCGEVASGIVRDTVLKEVSEGHSLLRAVESGHAAILDAIDEGTGAQGMGSTVVALLLHDVAYDLCWVGDSRAYVWNGKLKQLTRDHNRVSELLDKKVITSEQANSHPERHVLTQSLGVSTTMELAPGHVSGELEPGQSLLLCSDGITDELSDSLIAHLLADHHSPRAQVDALMSAALDAGGRDNITAVVIGSETLNEASATRDDLETTHSGRRSASGGIPNDGKFPLRALLLVSALALLAALFLL